MANKVNNIVLACETENARSLVDPVNETLTEKLVDTVTDMKHEIGKTLLGENITDVSTGEWHDRYEGFEPQIQEAIDQVVEEVDKGSDIDESIERVSEEKKVDKEKLREYFDSMSENYSISVDSTKENGVNTLRNHERMDDEDVSKRVRYEATTKDLMNYIVEHKLVVLDSTTGLKTYNINEQQTTALKTVFDNLNEENQNLMVEKLTSTHSNFIEMVSWCLQPLNNQGRLMDTKFTQMIEPGKLLEAQDILNEALIDKAAEYLVEKRKQIVAKTFKTSPTKTKKPKKDEKSIFKADKRKAARNKMKNLKKVKK